MKNILCEHRETQHSYKQTIKRIQQLFKNKMAWYLFCFSIIHPSFSKRKLLEKYMFEQRVGKVTCAVLTELNMFTMETMFLLGKNNFLSYFYCEFPYFWCNYSLMNSLNKKTTHFPPVVKILILYWKENKQSLTSLMKNHPINLFNLTKIITQDLRSKAITSRRISRDYCNVNV